jgi:hypothetical protein
MYKCLFAFLNAPPKKEKDTDGTDTPGKQAIKIKLTGMKIIR